MSDQKRKLFTATLTLATVGLFAGSAGAATALDAASKTINRARTLRKASTHHTPENAKPDALGIASTLVRLIKSGTVSPAATPIAAPAMTSVM